MTEERLQLLNDTLKILVKNDELCNKCIFKHKDDRGYFCYFAFNCFSNDNREFFKEST